jgi:hypothetical protein
MRGYRAVDIEDAPVDSLPTFFGPAIDRAGDGANDTAEGQRTERDPYCEAPVPSPRERLPERALFPARRLARRMPHFDGRRVAQPPNLRIIKGRPLFGVRLVVPTNHPERSTPFYD